MFKCFRHKSKPTANKIPNYSIPVENKVVKPLNPENLIPKESQQKIYSQENSNGKVNKNIETQPLSDKAINGILNYHMTHSGVEINYEGWGEEKKENRNDKNEGKTEFVKQIGAQLKHVYLDDNSNQKGNHSAQNPLQFLGFGTKNTPIENTTNTENLSQNEILKLLVFQLNPIFNKKQQNNSFPSPFIKYKIIPVIDEKKSLDSTSVNDEKRHLQKNSMIIWDYHGGPNQLFYINSQGNGHVKIINVARAFTIKSCNDQKSVFAEPKRSGQGSHWVLTQVGHNEYEIKSAENGKVLELEKSKGSNGTMVVLGAKTGAKNQKWRIVPS